MKHFSYICLFLLAFSSCSLRAVREAQDVVAEADSLWAAGQMYGRDSGDSATLAQAYEQLSNLSPITYKLSIIHTASADWKNYQLSTIYAHACYHYGRFLRERENPVAAMKCFINATHSNTRDYHILGRVYSNMGDICHLAGEFELSYDMFEQSADFFLNATDTLAYYYALNDMAFELAVLSQKDSCFYLLDRILNGNIEDSYLKSYCSLTRAKAYIMNHQYDSAIIYAKQYEYMEYTQYPILIIAQAYDNLEKKDSALLYANMILLASNATYQEKFDALYIVRNNDSTLQATDISALASQREDIRYYEYEPHKKKLSIAVQLLIQNIERNNKYQKLNPYIYLLLLTIFAFVIYIVCHLHNIKKIFKQEKHNLEKREQELLVKQDKAVQMQAEYARSEQERIQEIENRCKVLRATSNLKEQLVWRQYEEMCRLIDQQFYLLTGKLKQQEKFNERDIRLCVLVLIDLNHTDIANLMYVEEGSVGKLKERTAKKLHTTRKNMRQALLKLVLGNSFDSYK